MGEEKSPFAFRHGRVLSAFISFNKGSKLQCGGLSLVDNCLDAQPYLLVGSCHLVQHWVSAAKLSSCYRDYMAREAKTISCRAFYWDGWLTPCLTCLGWCLRWQPYLWILTPLLAALTISKGRGYVPFTLWPRADDNGCSSKHVCVAGTQLCGWKNILCLLTRIKEHCVLLGGTEALDNFFRQRKPRKMPLNDLAPVQVPTRVGKERVWKMGLEKH